MLHGVPLVPATLIVSLIASACPVFAQEHVTLRSDLLFYGDNTEFHNPFREGETLFGTALRVAAVVDMNDRVSVTLGGFGNLRFGSDDAFELVRPVVALTFTGRRSAFVFGTLPPPKVGVPAGPDRTGPHGLLPPIQRETLAFDRPYEAGLAWMFDGSAIKHELWIDWQRLNTPDHRERFDAGAVGELRLSSMFSIPFQLHVVHEGGQLFASGPVADSWAVGSGFIVRPRLSRVEAVALEAYGLASRFVPDRGEPTRSRDGSGFFARGSVEHHGWRGHVIAWRGWGFLKDEGDRNYLSVRRDQVRYRGTRDYAEAGLARTFRPAPGVLLEASGRFHRIEKNYEYSFRIAATASLAWRLH
jgi:hypothetical protein